MRRRDLFKRLGVIAAAVTLAPSVKPVEAGPVEVKPLTQDEIDALYVKAYGQRRVDSWAPDPPEYWCTDHLDSITGAGHWHPYPSPPAVKSEAGPVDDRASEYARLMEEYKRGLVSREELLNDFPELRMASPLTFEAMSKDCAERDHLMFSATRYSGDDPHAIYHVTDMAHTGGTPTVSVYDYSVDNQENVLARVDAWRTGLHEQADRDIEDDTAMRMTYLS